MKRFTTLAEGKPFEFFTICTEEILVYPCDEMGEPQRREALVITPFLVQFVKERISAARHMEVGASRGKPPIGSLGAHLKEQGVSPRNLDYLCAILVEQGFCTFAKGGKGVRLFLK